MLLYLTSTFIVNLTDPVFRGYHHGRKKHDGEIGLKLKYFVIADIDKDDFEAMLERARAAGVRSMIITGGSLHESREALGLAETHGTITVTISSRNLILIKVSTRPLVVTQRALDNLTSSAEDRRHT